MPNTTCFVLSLSGSFKKHVISCSSVAAQRGPDSIPDQVFVNWPLPAVALLVSGELATCVEDPCKCLLPRVKWPSEPPRKKLGLLQGIGG